jgi:membrane peptidoglycan carboxypeptidase
MDPSAGIRRLGRSAPRSRLSSIGATVIGVWGLIFVVAFFAVFASDLPDTSKLYDVKRQPSINYLDRSGALLAVRGSQYAPPVDIDALPKYVPAAFVAIEDRQFYHHLGFNPWGIGRAAGVERHPRRPAARRLDHHPAAGPQPVPDPTRTIAARPRS